jgi:hypothetical protein
MYKPTQREAAMLLLYALQERGHRRGKPLSRARLSQLTLKSLWNREQLTEAWLREVNEWLLSAGWVVIDTGMTYGAIRTAVVENWPRVASKHIEDVLDQVHRGSFDFSKLEPLLQETARTEPIGVRPKTTKRSRKVTRNAT